MPEVDHYTETLHCVSSDVSLPKSNGGFSAQTVSAVLFCVSELISHKMAIHLEQGKVCAVFALHSVLQCKCCIRVKDIGLDSYSNNIVHHSYNENMSCYTCLPYTI